MTIVYNYEYSQQKIKLMKKYFLNPFKLLAIIAQGKGYVTATDKQEAMLLGAIK
jgi:hypothetical protein